MKHQFLFITNIYITVNPLKYGQSLKYGQGQALIRPKKLKMGVNGIFVKQFFSKKIVEKIRPWPYFRGFTVY
jgi:hypothetical protein